MMSSKPEGLVERGEDPAPWSTRAGQQLACAMRKRCPGLLERRTRTGSAHGGCCKRAAVRRRMRLGCEALQVSWIQPQRQPDDSPTAPRITSPHVHDRPATCNCMPVGSCTIQYMAAASICEHDLCKLEAVCYCVCSTLVCYSMSYDTDYV